MRTALLCMRCCDACPLRGPLRSTLHHARGVRELFLCEQTSKTMSKSQSASFKRKAEKHTRVLSSRASDSRTPGYMPLRGTVVMLHRHVRAEEHRDS